MNESINEPVFAVLLLSSIAHFPTKASVFMVFMADGFDRVSAVSDGHIIVMVSSLFNNAVLGPVP
jgi:hypothetical protein